jgi:hypothetical protein
MRFFKIVTAGGVVAAVVRGRCEPVIAERFAEDFTAVRINLTEYAQLLAESAEVTAA